jgi:signal peptidase II
LTLRAAAAGIAALALAATIGLERLLMHVEACVLIPGFADFNPTLNHGVSFGLFTQDSATGRHLLMIVLAALSAVIAICMWRAASTLAAIGFALILAGALGNLSDRLQFNGGVFDFLALHLGAMPLFICNLADIFISAGAVLLVVDSMLPQRTDGKGPRFIEG